MTNAVNLATAAATGFLRNRIINGGHAIDQRNSGAAQTITAAAALAYTVDRWYAYCTGANVTGQRVAGALTNTFRYQFTGAASVTAIGFAQRIESYNIADLAGSTVTLSVDLANSLLTTVTWTAYYANTQDAFGTLASPTRTQIATGTFTVNSTVTRYRTNISLPSGATSGVEIVFSVGAQTSGAWTIGNVQLEPGTVATPFEKLPYQQILAQCQRYYWQSEGGYSYFGGYQTGSGDMTFVIPLPVTMRATPTVGRSGGWTATNVTQQAWLIGKSNFIFTLRCGSSGPGYLSAQSDGIFTATIEL